MPPAEIPDLLPAAAELFLAFAGMALLMLGVFQKSEDDSPVGTSRLVAHLGVTSLALALLLVLAFGRGPAIAFGGLFVVESFAVFAKALVLIGSGIALVISQDYLERHGAARFEYGVLIVFATLGMMMMVSANDLISLYMGLEIQSLSLYVVAAIKRDSHRSSEAGLKYFVLGALSSGMLLYGCSMIYGFSGSTNFQAIAVHVSATGGASVGLIVGIAFLTAGLAFKVSAVPFHMWTPDVYEGAPTPITAFFAVAPKIAAIVLFIRAMVVPFAEATADWQQIVVFISLLSMVLGAFAAIWQTNIKRLMAYSSIGHIGFALMGLAAGTADGVRATLVYMAIYLFMNVGTFDCILCMRRRDGMVEGINDLAGLDRNDRPMALALMIFMFSMAGVPPAAGFFGKFYVFMAAVQAELYLLAIVGVLSSVVAAVYYLRIIKIMYFDDPAEPFLKPIGPEMKVILTVSSLFIVLFVVYPAPLLEGAQAAAAALMP